jgi:hypothetical protein
MNFKLTPALAAALLLVIAPACPDFTAGIPCSKDQECPSGNYCVDRKCVKGVNPAPAQFTVSANTMDFGNVQTGSYLDRSVSVTNIALSKSPIYVRGVVTGGGGSGVFASLSEQYAVVNPGDKTAITVRYTPKGQINDEGILTVSTNEPEDPVKEIPLVGREISPEYSAKPDPLEFGKVNINSKVSPQVLKIENTSADSPFDITELSVELVDAVPLITVDTEGRLPLTLAGGQSVEFNVSLNTSSKGAIGNNILLRTNVVKEPLRTIRVTGEVMDCEPGWITIKDPCDCKQDQQGSQKCGKDDIRKFIDPGTKTEIVFREAEQTQFKFEGNLVAWDVTKAVEWFTFMAVDDVTDDIERGGDLYKVDVKLETTDPGIVMNVYKGCGPLSTALCEEQECSDMGFESNRFCSGTMKYIADGFTDRYDDRWPSPTKINPEQVSGECPCKKDEDDPKFRLFNQNSCHDNSTRYYIMLFRLADKPLTCTKYSLTISNGVGSKADCYTAPAYLQDLFGRP